MLPSRARRAVYSRRGDACAVDARVDGRAVVAAAAEVKAVLRVGDIDRGRGRGQLSRRQDK